MFFLSMVQGMKTHELRRCLREHKPNGVSAILLEEHILVHCVSTRNRDNLQSCYDG